MLWWTQLIIVAISIISFMVLVAIYRRQDAMPQVYWLSLLLAVGGCFVPDAWTMYPLLVANIIMLRAWNIRVMIALLLGLLTVGLYGTLAWFIWPDSAFIADISNQITLSFNRTFCLSVLPTWMVISSAALAVIGIVTQFAHFSRYTTANVRIQTRVLLVTPLFWLAMLSVVFPVINGSCLLSVLWACALYLLILYMGTYGLPKMPSIRRKHNPYRRSYKRRRR